MEREYEAQRGMLHRQLEAYMAERKAKLTALDCELAGLVLGNAPRDSCRNVSPGREAAALATPVPEQPQAPSNGAAGGPALGSGPGKARGLEAGAGSGAAAATPPALERPQGRCNGRAAAVAPAAPQAHLLGLLADAAAQSSCALPGPEQGSAGTSARLRNHGSARPSLQRLHGSGSAGPSASPPHGNGGVGCSASQMRDIRDRQPGLACPWPKRPRRESEEEPAPGAADKEPRRGQAGPSGEQADRPPLFERVATRPRGTGAPAGTGQAVPCDAGSFGARTVAAGEAAAGRGGGPGLAVQDTPEPQARAFLRALRAGLDSWRELPQASMKPVMAAETRAEAADEAAAAAAEVTATVAGGLDPGDVAAAPGLLEAGVAAGAAQTGRLGLLRAGELGLNKAGAEPRMAEAAAPAVGLGLATAGVGSVKAAAEPNLDGSAAAPAAAAAVAEPGWARAGGGVPEAAREASLAGAAAAMPAAAEAGLGLVRAGSGFMEAAAEPGMAEAADAAAAAGSDAAAAAAAAKTDVDDTAATATCGDGGRLDVRCGENFTTSATATAAKADATANPGAGGCGKGGGMGLRDARDAFAEGDAADVTAAADDTPAMAVGVCHSDDLAVLAAAAAAADDEAAAAGSGGRVGDSCGAVLMASRKAAGNCMDEDGLGRVRGNQGACVGDQDAAACSGKVRRSCT